MAIRLSHSQMSIIEECELKWYKRYVLREPVPENPTFFIIGSACHNAIEHWLNSQVWLKDTKNARAILSALMAKYIEAELDKYPALDFPQEWVDEAMKTIPDKTVDGLRDNRLFSKKMIVELDIIPPLFGCACYVKPDLITFRSDDSAVVTDFKTSRDNKWNKPEQLELYALGLRHAKKMPITEAGFLMLRTGEWIPVDVEDTQEFRNKVKRRINNAFLAGTALKVGTREPKASPGSACKNCDYRKQCKSAPDGAPISL